ncbi:MAG TPA: IPT/TIG domain-containing protein [Solirubrobacteraceae bacterium]|nr:IPT/TIG domain-containing protein [Solirubrobacteraceae bacterium]
MRSVSGGSVRLALPGGGPSFEGGGEHGGIDPEELRSAYAIPASGGERQTVAVVELYGYKAAESDLAVYRSRYGLPACTKKNGCFRHVNAQGGKPKNRLLSRGWETESALDLDMVSAACPHCHILLVDEATSLKELGEGEDTAVALGASEVSNSYGLPEEACTTECEAADYHHPGVFVMASAADWGYDDYGEGARSPSYPAVLPAVVAVGGTSLKKAASERGWSEAVWWEPERAIGTGSGCASARAGAKPTWQPETGCSGRADNDVAAVGACITPVSMYASIEEGGWLLVCGTSVSSPLVAGIEAHADAFARSLPGADSFYHDPSAFFDVTSGSNGFCSSPPGHEDLCNAGIGWDGPSGNGTPDGPLELTGAAPNASTEPASAVSASGVKFNGVVEADGLPTAYRFEYGTSTAYGSSAPAPEGSAGSGTTAQTVSATVGGLQPETIYHYRLVATNGEGTAYGRDQEFETAAAAAPVITEVSPNGGGRTGYRPVQITGANFVDVTGVSFDSTSASFTVNSPTSITATVPAGEKEGAEDVTVRTLAGTSVPGPASEYTYTLGGMLAWGRDGGDLGRGPDGSPSDVPVEVAGELPEVKQLTANHIGSAALLKDGEVDVWGGAYADLGDGGFVQHYTPMKVCAVGVVGECPDGPHLQDVAQLVSGDEYFLALLDNGTVVGWGVNGTGQLGGGAPLRETDTPVPVCTVVEEPCSPAHFLTGVVQLAAGDKTSYALLGNGTELAWGSNGSEGALGDGTSEGDGYSQSPVQVKGLTGVSSIAGDGHGGLALLGNGTVEAWGWNEYGTLGDGSNAEWSPVPVPVCSGTGKHGCGSDLDEVTAVYGTEATSYALLRDGSVMAWGSNASDNLGDPDTETGPETCKVGIHQEKMPCVKTPLKVDISEVSQLATGQGEGNVLALLKSGELLAWGTGGEAGDLGDGERGGSKTPRHVCAAYATAPCPTGPYLGGEVLAMAAGGYHDLVYVKR